MLGCAVAVAHVVIIVCGRTGGVDRQALRPTPLVREDGSVLTEPSGQELAAAYYADVVKPLLASAFPRLPHAAGRLGSGSDVLGLDDATSRDHDWGLRLTLFVPPSTEATVDAELRRSLPDTFRGLPTRFAFTGQTDRRHHVDVSTLSDFLHERLGADPREGMTASDWLSLTGQAVLEVVAGPIFADDDGEVREARRALQWYPAEVWRYVLASDWSRLGEELPLMGRAADAGDELGSRVIAARLVHIAMHLAFLLDRRWAPYSKWFGTLFGRLPLAAEVADALVETLDASSWPQRQAALCRALQSLLEAQNALGLGAMDADAEGTRSGGAVTEATVAFWDRPYRHPDPRIVADLMDAVTDPQLRSLAVGAGSVEQRTDNVAVLVDASARRALIGA